MKHSILSTILRSFTPLMLVMVMTIHSSELLSQVCDPGYFYNLLTSLCDDCSEGTFQSEAGQTSCIDCPAGRYQDDIAQISCKDCLAGTYSNAPGLQSCIPCEIGSYQNLDAAVSCIPCEEGFYQDNLGANSCKECPPGYISPKGSTSSSDCVPNNQPGSVDITGKATVGFMLRTNDAEDIVVRRADGTLGYRELSTMTDKLPQSPNPGEMMYWNGIEWVIVAATVNNGATLQMIGGVPTWVGGTPPLVSGEVLNPTTGKVWMDRNLGALQVATDSADYLAYGDLYQWGRGSDGHQIRTSDTTSTNANTAVPNANNSWDNLFITEETSPVDWLTPQDSNLWQGLSGTNNPCPTGYRLPTEDEWQAERMSWSTNNAAGAFASPLKLPLAGVRSNTDGSLYFVANYGYYWSGTVSVSDARMLVFASIDAGMFTFNRAGGFSVRCLKD